MVRLFCLSYCLEIGLMAACSLESNTTICHSERFSISAFNTLKRPYCIFMSWKHPHLSVQTIKWVLTFPLLESLQCVLCVLPSPPTSFYIKAKCLMSKCTKGFTSLPINPIALDIFLNPHKISSHSFFFLSQQVKRLTCWQTEWWGTKEVLILIRLRSAWIL